MVVANLTNKRCRYQLMPVNLDLKIGTYENMDKCTAARVFPSAIQDFRPLHQINPPKVNQTKIIVLDHRPALD